MSSGIKHSETNWHNQWHTTVHRHRAQGVIWIWWAHEGAFKEWETGGVPNKQIHLNTNFSKCHLKVQPKGAPLQMYPSYLSSSRSAPKSTLQNGLVATVNSNPPVSCCRAHWCIWKCCHGRPRVFSRYSMKDAIATHHCREVRSPLSLHQ